MKPGECWYLNNTNNIKKIFSNPPGIYDKRYKTKNLLKNEVFMVLEISECSPEYDYYLSILIDNEKWYFEIFKESVEAGVVKKLEI